MLTDSLMTLPESASVLELTWTSVAFLGAAVAAGLLVHVWASYRTVLRWISEGLAVRWGPRHQFALGFVVGVGLLLLVWLGFVALGANALGNLPPDTADRAASSERGGWILVTLELILFLFQCVLLAAWVAVGRPTIVPETAPNSPIALLLRAIDYGREMGHLIASDLQRPVMLLDKIARDHYASETIRTEAAEAIADLDRVMERTRALHAKVKALEPKP